MSPRARGTFGNKYLSGDPSQAVGKKQRQVGGAGSQKAMSVDGFCSKSKFLFPGGMTWSDPGLLSAHQLLC